MSPQVRHPVLLLGDANFDLVLQLPPGDSEAEALVDLAPHPTVGGTTGNVAKALVFLGIQTRLACAVGEDGHGRFLRRGLAEAGIDMRHVHVTPNHDTLVITVIVDRSGQRYFARFPPLQHAASFYPPGKLTPENIAEVGWLHSSGSCFDHGTTADAVMEAMGWARQAGVPISFDLNLRFQEVVSADHGLERIRQAVTLSDYVLGSGIDEMAPLAGVADPLEAAHILSDGQRTVIARAGAEGAFRISPSGALDHVPALPVRVVDTLGAGDAFDAGFVAGMVAGVSSLEAIRWGNALAALTISQEGAARSINREQLVRTLKRLHV
jgi:fructokinase